jgi:hypothetical protein
MDDCTRKTRILDLMDNDEALSLPYERVVGLLGEIAEPLYIYAAFRGSVRLLKWARENNGDWNSGMCAWTAREWDTCPLSSTCTRTGALGTRTRAWLAVYEKRWDCPEVRGG